MTTEEFVTLIKLYVPGFEPAHLPVPFRNLGLDSLAMIQVRVQIEKECGLVIPHKEWFKFSSFHDVADYLRLNK